MSSIGAISGNSGMAMHGMGARPRPDPAAMAEKLFGALDTNGQGYIEQADLESALGQIGTDANDAAELFARLDGDGDGKVTQDEFSTAMQAAAAELDAQFGAMRMQGGMPPPPPADDTGFTQDELENQLSAIGDSDDRRASLISNIVANFEAADTDGDGKVSFAEARAYDRESGTGGDKTAANGADGTNGEAKLLLQLARLVEAYGIGGERGGSGSLSVAA